MRVGGERDACNASLRTQDVTADLNERTMVDNEPDFGEILDMNCLRSMWDACFMSTSIGRATVHAFLDLVGDAFCVWTSDGRATVHAFSDLVGDACCLWTSDGRATAHAFLDLVGDAFCVWTSDGRATVETLHATSLRGKTRCVSELLWASFPII